MKTPSYNSAFSAIEYPELHEKIIRKQQKTRLKAGKQPQVPT